MCDNVFSVEQFSQNPQNALPVWFRVTASTGGLPVRFGSRSEAAATTLWMKVVMIRNGDRVAEMLASYSLSSLPSTLLRASLSLLTNGSPTPTTQCVAANPERLLHVSVAPQSPPWPSPSPSTAQLGTPGFWLSAPATPSWTCTSPHTVEALLPVLNPLSHNSQWFCFPWLTLDWYTYLLDQDCERIRHVFVFLFSNYCVFLQSHF